MTTLTKPQAKVLRTTLDRGGARYWWHPEVSNSAYYPEAISRRVIDRLVKLGLVELCAVQQANRQHMKVTTTPIVLVTAAGCLALNTFEAQELLNS